MISIPSDNNKDEETGEKPVDFETAITETGFGLFNYVLYFFAIFGCFGTFYEASATSYILPQAECDLQITLEKKGMLNAVTYAGMMSSAILWGVIADSKGRQKILTFGYLADGLTCICASLSQNITTFMIFKFMGGFIINGPFAILVSYLSEFHNTKRRSLTLMLVGVNFALGGLSLPFLAWAIFPQDWGFNIGTWSINTWQLFLISCSIPSLVAGCIAFFLPESPKFLMSKGRNREAMEVFRKIYAINHMKSGEQYPIKKLLREDLTEESNEISEVEMEGKEQVENIDNEGPEDSFWVSLIDDIKKMRILFYKEFLGRSLHAYALQFCSLMGLNTIRLWLPQLFVIIAEYEENVLVQGNNTDTNVNLCTMLTHGVNRTFENTQGSENCEVHFSSSAYFNNVVVSLVGVVCYLLSGTIINTIGVKRLMVSGLFICAILGISFYWSTTSTVTLIISSLYSNIAGVCGTALLGVVVSCFPTNLRTIVLCVVMMFGRFGALIGNVIFPYLLAWGCLQSFIYVTVVMLLASFLSAFLPKDSNKMSLK